MATERLLVDFPIDEYPTQKSGCCKAAFVAFLIGIIVMPTAFAICASLHTPTAADPYDDLCYVRLQFTNVFMLLDTAHFGYVMSSSMYYNVRSETYAVLKERNRVNSEFRDLLKDISAARVQYFSLVDPVEVIPFFIILTLATPVILALIGFVVRCCRTYPPTRREKEAWSVLNFFMRGIAISLIVVFILIATRTCEPYKKPVVQMHFF